MRSLATSALALVLLTAAPALAAEGGPTAGAPAAAPLTPPRYGTFGLDLEGRDPAVKPGDDFNGYANGRFLSALKIPADRTGYGVNYMLTELSERQVHAILEEAARTQAAGRASGDEARVGGFYRAFMDEARVEALGLKPLQADLARVRALKTREEAAREMGRAATGFGSSLFGLYIDADAKAPTRYAVNLVQAGLGLPDRDYYLDAQFAEKKQAYRAYVARMLKMIGWAEPDARAADIVALETRIAEASWSRTEQRDPEKTYNPMSVGELAKAAPGFDWRGFLDAAELKGVDRLIVGENTAVPRIAALYAGAPLPVIRAWLAFNLIDNAAPYLSKAPSDARFAFRSRTLSGVPEQRERWKRGVAAVDGAMGEAVGRVYVERHFPPAAKARIDALVTDLRAAMKIRLQGLDWMAPATRAEALKKLDQFTVKIAYPDRWRDYSAIRVDPADLYGNVERGVAFEWRRQLARLNDPVDRSEWGMTPQTANAYFNPTMNEIVFPAGELQPPFFDPDADPAVNYGGIGSVIGHEMIHGFDDEGRKFGGDGQLRDWWTPEDAKRFEAEAAKLGAQYSGYEAAPGAKINGELTMGENIADLGGLIVAYDAYRLSLKGAPAPVVGGLTGDQRFFLAYAQGWRDKRREEAVRQQLVSDPHAPEAFRVNGVVRNMDAWYAAFDVQPGDKLALSPEARVRIW